MDEIRPTRKPPRANTSRLRHPIASDTPHNPGSIGSFTGGFSDPPTFTPNADSRKHSEFGEIGDVNPREQNGRTDQCVEVVVT